MKIELKKFQFSERMSEETNAFTADVFVNGKKVAFAKNAGHGGSTDYHAYENMSGLLVEAEKYCAGLPAYTYAPMFKGDTDLSVAMDLETMIDNLVEEQLKLKEEKKREKKYTNHLVWGVPGASSYTVVKFSAPLDKFPVERLQQSVDKYKAQFKAGEQFFNTNFKALGIKA